MLGQLGWQVSIIYEFYKMLNDYSQVYLIYCAILGNYRVLNINLINK